MKNSKKTAKNNRGPAWLLLLGLLATVAGYIFWMPYDPQSLYRAIPSHATVISVHENLAGRYHDFSTNPLLANIFEEFMPDRPPPVMSAGQARLAALIAGRQTVTAWVPHMLSTGRPGLVAATWAGNSALALRWHLAWTAGADWERVPDPTGRAVWYYAHPVNRDGWRLAVAFGEGVLMALCSPDPAGIRDVIRAYEGMLPSVDMAADDDFHQLPAGAPDRIRMYHPVDAALAVENIDADEIRLRLRSAALPARSRTAIPADMLATSDWLPGNLPAMTAVLSAGTAAQVLPYLPAPYAGLINDFIQPAASDTRPGIMGWALLTDEHGGAFGQAPWRIRIPALLIFRRTARAEDAHLIMRRLLDNLNAAFQYGLIIDPGSGLPAGQDRIYTIEATDNKFLAQLAPEDRPAYAVIDDWLLLCTHAGALRQRLTDPQHTSTAEQPDWHARINQRQPSGLIWMDMPRAGRTLQLLLTAISMRLQHPDHQAALATVNTLRDRLTGLQTMQHGLIMIAAEEPEVEAVVSGRH